MNRTADIPQESLERFMARHGLDSLIVIGTRGEREVVLRATAEAESAVAVEFQRKVEQPLRILLNDVLLAMGRQPVATNSREVKVPGAALIVPGKVERRIPLVPADDRGLLKVPEGFEQ